MDRPALIKLLILFVLFAVASCSSMGTNGPDGYILQKTNKPKPSAPAEDPSSKSSKETVTTETIGGAVIVKGTNDIKKQTAPDELVPLKSKNKGTRRTAPVKVKYRVNSMHFKDVDNNKDGRISAVELGAVIPGLTMEDFKKYDKNGDGSLDETEYRSVRKR